MSIATGSRGERALELAEYRGPGDGSGGRGGSDGSNGSNGSGGPSKKSGKSAGLPMSVAGNYNPWFIAVIVSIATFMEVLDTSIANVSLRNIAGGLSAGQDEATWVLTSYLVSNAIVLPISGWLSGVIGRKKFYMGCVALFTISSFMCGVSTSLTELIFFRVLQGAGGGGLAPSEQAMLRDSFPASKIGPVFALYSIVVIAAPAIGPVLGGYITDHYSWHWIFIINVPFGVLSLLLVGAFLTEPTEEVRRVEAKRSQGFSVDYVGFGLVALSMGTLQVVLDRGQQDDWFGSTFILAFVVISAVTLVGLIVRELLIDDPIVDLRLLFSNRNFFMSCAIRFFTFFILLGTTQLIPQMVQTLFGYTAFDAGMVITPGAVGIILTVPAIGFIIGKVQAKYLVMVGLLAEAAATWHLTGLDLNASFEAVVWARIYQALPLALLIVPISTAAYTGLPDTKTNEASALLNFARNIGGSFGISFGQTWLTRRAQLHQNHLISNLTPYDSTYRDGLAQIKQGLMQTGAAAGDAQRQAVGTLYGMVQRQAQMISYLDVFYVLTFAGLALVPFCLLLKNDKGAHGGEGGGH